MDAKNTHAAYAGNGPLTSGDGDAGQMRQGNNRTARSITPFEGTGGWASWAAINRWLARQRLAFLNLLRWQRLLLRLFPLDQMPPRTRNASDTEPLALEDPSVMPVAALQAELQRLGYEFRKDSAGNRIWWSG